RICVCATYGLRRATETPRRGRNASNDARNAASENRKAIRAEAASQVEKFAGESPVGSGPKSWPINGISRGAWLASPGVGDATGTAVVLPAVLWSSRKT